MKINIYHYILIGLIVLMTGTLIAKCVRNKEPEKHEQVRLDIVNYDLVNTEKLKKQQDSLIKRNKALELALSKKEIEYIPIRIKAEEAVIKYEKQPIIENCEPAIVLLKTQNVLADSIIVNLKQIGVNKDSLTASKNRLIAVKDKTISDLNTAFLDLNEDLKQAKKPKKWTLSAGVGFGMPIPVINHSLKNIKENPGLIKPGPNFTITIGRNLWSFGK